MAQMIVTYDPSKAGDELLPGAMYFTENPDGSKEWFTVAAKKTHTNGMNEYVVISTTYGRSHLKDVQSNYKQLRAKCVLWDVATQAPAKEEADVDIQPEPVTIDSFQLEI